MKAFSACSIVSWMAMGSLLAQPRYTVTNLGPLLGNTASVCINDYGDMAGTVWTADWNLAEVYRLRAGKSPEWLGIFSSWSEEAFINNRGQVAGTYWYDLDGYGTLHGFVYSDEAGMMDVGTLGGPNTVVFGFNNLGQVTGASDTPDNPNLDHDPNMAFRYTPGLGIQALGTLPGGASSAGFAINDLGWIAGRSLTTNCISHDCDEHESHTVRYSDQTGMVDLGALSGRTESYPTAINNLGVMVGASGGGFTPRRGFLAYGNTMEELPNLGGNDTIPMAINNLNVVVGRDVLRISGSPEIWRAFIWTETEGILDLNALIEPDSGFHLWAASDINNRGQIIAGGSQGSLLLNPIPPRLTTQLTSSNLVVSWRPPWPGLVLEASESLSEPDWQPVSSGQTNVVTVSRDLPRCFFRLNLETLQGLCCAAP